MKTDSNQIIICADDYAISPAVSLGIRELIKKRRINATSVMSLSQFWHQDAKRLQLLLSDMQAQDCFSIGLHITLTDFKPITHMPSFTRKGYMPSVNNVLIKSFLGMLPLDEIRSEIKAQFEKFIADFGRLPDHIDGHCHVHLFPNISQLVVEIYNEYYKDQKVLVRNCSNSDIKFFNFRKSLKANFLHNLSKSFIKTLVKNKIPTNDSFSGVYNFNLKKNNYHLLFKSFIREAKGNTIIMCHPGYIDSYLKLVDPITLQREVELDYFMGASFDGVLQQASLD